MTNPEFGSEQQQVLHANLLASIESGLASRYYATKVEHAKRLARLAALPGDPASDKLRKIADITSVAGAAEAPFVFGLEPSNMAESVVASKLNPNNGEIIPGSDVQIGLINGLAGNGRPTAPFTQEDLIFATESIATQEAVGLRTC